MKFEFTPAAHRALSEAARWSSLGADAPLDLPELLLGLLAEEECRAAALLSAAGINIPTVLGRWPSLRATNPSLDKRSRDFALSVQSALAEAQQRLRELPQPLSLATEHLLLGILSAPSDVSQWLREHGLAADQLQAQIFGWEGIEPGPLPFGERPSVENRATRLAVSSPSLPEEHCVPHAGLPRILDAAANRAREAVRVVEDYVRFVLDDQRLTGELKSLRHDLTALLRQLPASQLLVQRDTAGDVGTTLSTESERHRADPRQVAAANFKRLQESLRSLEEFSKTLDADLAAGFEQIRYRAYDLERRVFLDAPLRARLDAARLYVLIDGQASLEAFESLAASLIESGVHVLQLRDKRLQDRELLERARRLRELTESTATLFIMNDRPDLALLAGADGVHVGQEELSVSDARAIVGPRLLIGVSTHSLQQARAALADGADYIGVGPTFPSNTKQFESYTGLELLRDVAAEISLPAFAIGGITLANLPDVLGTGMRRIAVSGGVIHDRQPASAAKALLAALNRCGA